MPYAWGSRTAIAELQGRPSPSAHPEAELWMGAHVRGSSRLSRGGRAVTLLDAIAADSVGELGDRVAETFGPQLPFLMKVLAAAAPLSLQAHPSLAQAAEGFAREDRLGIPLDAPHRNYKDPSHKPELICALTPFDALCGFRPVEETLALFDALGVSELDATIAPLRWSDRDAGIAATLHAIMTRAEPARTEMVNAVLAACAEYTGPFAAECAWALRLSTIYPDDPGIVTALLLNLVHLEPGEAIYLDAGNLHAYLDGVGVELMASSDNVLRGGLTPKHVDLDELLRVLKFSDHPIAPLRPTMVDRDEVRWETPAREFQLSRITVADRAIERLTAGPEILLCVDGRVRLADDAGEIEIGRGQAAFVAGNQSRYVLTGRGDVFRAVVAPISDGAA